MLEFVGENQVRYGQDQTQDRRDTLEDVSDKESFVEKPWFIEGVRLGTRQTTTAATVDIVRVPQSTRSFENKVIHEGRHAFSHRSSTGCIAALD